MTRYPDLFAALAAKFTDQEVRSRKQAGRDVHYVTARTVMNRLDTVLGPENWSDDYVPGESSILCRLTVQLPDGTRLTKADAGGKAGMSDDGDDDKSGYSDAFKRAAVKFGVGRYLYRDGVPTFAGPPPATALAAPQPKALPAPRPTKESAWGGAATEPARSPRSEWAPQTGRELRDWVKDQEQEFEVQLQPLVSGWAKSQGYPPLTKDWSVHQIATGYEQGQRIVKELLEQREAVV